MKEAKVMLKPIDKKAWHGKNGKDSFSSPKKLPALVGPDLKYKTGLKEKDIKFIKSTGFVGDLSNNFNSETPHPFWDENKMARVVLKNSTQIFDPNTVEGRIQVCIMRASEFVANSEEDYENGLYPEATHVLYDESHELELKANVQQRKDAAVLEVNKLNTTRKQQLLLVLTGKVAKGKSDNFLTVHIGQLIDKRADEVLEYLSRDPEVTSVAAFVKEALAYNSLQKQGHRILYFDSVLGNSEEEVVEYFLKEENQSLMLEIQERNK